MDATLEQVWSEFAGRLRHFIRSRVRNHAAGEDILQDVFLKIQKRIGTLKDPAKIEGWLYLIARNAIIDYYRSRKEHIELPETLPSEPGESADDHEGLKAAFRRMIHALPGPYREALILTEFEGLTQKELAERLSISVSGAKSRVQRGREQLKRKLLECCEFEFDRRGGIIECNPRNPESCTECVQESGADLSKRAARA